MMNKKGTIVLRNVMFMIILFAGVMTLSALFITSMATEYLNDEMVDEFRSLGNIGGEMLTDLDRNVTLMANETVKATGSFALVTGIVNGAGTILFTVLTFPVMVSNVVATLFTSLGVPDQVADVIKFMISLTLYSIIIFVIISSLLKGGKV